MNWDTIILGVLTIISNVVTWNLAKKKYNVEVEASEIDNLRKSFESQQYILDDYNKKLKFYIDLSESNRYEMYRLKNIIYKILDTACLSDQCVKRELYSEVEIKEILNVTTPINKKESNE